MKFIKGEIYDLIESCGMMILKGKYLGKGRYDDNYENLLVFELLERRTEHNAKFTAVKPEATLNSDGDKVSIILRTSYYGMTIEGIKPSTIWHREQPIFKLDEK